jgi:hypothetical protein
MDMMITGMKYSSLSGLFLLCMYGWYVSGFEKVTDSVAGKTGRDITWQIRSAHEVALYTNK